MSKIAKHTRLAARPGVVPLLHELAGNGMRWAEAELTLARVELVDLRRRCVTAAIFAGVAMAALLCALFIFAQTGVAAAAVLFESEVVAGLTVGAALVVLAALCAVGMRGLFNWQAESLFFRWLAPAPAKPRSSS